MKIHHGSWAGVILSLALMGCGRPGEREFLDGLRELKAGRAVEARNLLERAIGRQPGRESNASAWNYVGLACLQLNDLPAAAKAFEESRRLDPAQAEAAYNLGVLRMRSGDALAAETLLADAARLDSASPRAPEMLGHLYLSLQRWTDARIQFDDALRRSPRSPRILTALAVSETRLRQPQEAIAHLTAALDHDATYAPAVFNFFVLYSSALNLPNQAEPYARRYLALQPKDAARGAVLQEWLKSRPAAEPAPSRRATPARAATGPTLTQARDLAAQGSTRAALALCLRAAEQSRLARDGASRERALLTGTKLAFDQPAAHVALGRFLLEKKDFAAALATFRHASTLAPDMAEAHEGRGLAAVQAGEFDDALVSLRRALELNSDLPDAQWELAALYEQRLANPAQALGVLRDFARKFPEDPRSVRALDRVRTLERIGAAEPPAKDTPRPAPQALTAPPSLPPGGRALNLPPEAKPDSHAAMQALSRGQSYLDRKELPRAQYEFERAVKLNPRFAIAWFNLALVLRGRGELDLAKDAFARGLNLEPDNDTMRYNAALVLYDLKDTNAARTQLEYVAGRQASYAPAQYLLGLIESSQPDRLPQARQRFETFLRLSPQDPNAAQVKSWLDAHRG